jgi:hypothetical protein
MAAFKYLAKKYLNAFPGADIYEIKCLASKDYDIRSIIAGTRTPCLSNLQPISRALDHRLYIMRAATANKNALGIEYAACGEVDVQRNANGELCEMAYCYDELLEDMRMCFLILGVELLGLGGRGRCIWRFFWLL